MSKLSELGHRLHRGEVSYDFVGKRKIWYGFSILVTVVAIVGLAVNGLKLGIDFSGGAVFNTPKHSNISVAEAQSRISGDTGGHDATIQKLGNGSLRIQIADLSTDESKRLQPEIAKDLGLKSQQIDAEIIGPSWGKQISNKALEGLIIFLVLVVIYLAIAFEWRMALAALIALLHDLTITTGVYALVGFEVSPGTVIGLLTILGYSLYDTVVVFDGLKEASKDITRQSRFTYSDIANRSLNSTLVRSINTTVVALLPVAALLFIGGGILGAGVLNDIALALFIGLTAGAYSSIFIATPLVAEFKEREPQMRSLRKRVLAKRASDAAKAAQAAARGEDPEDAESADTPDADDDEDAAPAAAGVVGPRGRAAGSSASGSRPVRNQPNRTNRGRGRPSGKRR
ncbi:protein translocase subunit SecF [Actinacidiphila sp. DG2A-62]|jgi:preprotein translocase subunit SecF|uniref:protein translocase subunit SecF n=1 Tax=Actinacidiphila sp. DG2A-62 TaxID=3108821 RepID=UPI002DB57B7C|nr:protein translocase subunit SecF [Actinacidiphila sp. DG2A-62]MEC3992960.1 protein translocase subunit SecF [Actinacidiphila sp. DG2A-62]